MEKWKNKFKKNVSDFTLPRLLWILAGILIVFSFCTVLILTLNTKNFFSFLFWSTYNFSFIAIFLIAMSKTPKNQASISIYPFKLPAWSFLLFPVLVSRRGQPKWVGNPSVLAERGTC